MNGVRESLFVVVAGLVLLTGCAGRQSSSEVNFLREKSSDGEQMEALLEGRLTLTESCLRIRDAETSYAVIWLFAFDFSVQGGSVNVLNGDDQIVAQVGDQVRVSGGGGPGISPEEVEQLATGASQCPGPYWLAGYEVTVLTP